MKIDKNVTYPYQTMNGMVYLDAFLYSFASTPSSGHQPDNVLDRKPAWRLRMGKNRQ